MWQGLITVGRLCCASGCLLLSNKVALYCRCCNVREAAQRAGLCKASGPSILNASSMRPDGKGNACPMPATEFLESVSSVTHCITLVWLLRCHVPQPFSPVHVSLPLLIMVSSWGVFIHCDSVPMFVCVQHRRHRCVYVGLHNCLVDFAHLSSMVVFSGSVLVCLVVFACILFM
jgi:hypothetical protein